MGARGRGIAAAGGACAGFRGLWGPLAAAALAWALLLAAATASDGSRAQSRPCTFFERPAAHGFVARLDAYGDLRSQEADASAAVSAAVDGLALQLGERSPFARLAPTDFVAFRVFSCEVDRGSSGEPPPVCLKAEADLRALVEGSNSTRVVAIHDNNEYRRIELLEKRDLLAGSKGDDVELAANETIANATPPLKKFLSLRKRPRKQLVDELGIRALWDRGYKGQGVKVAVFDTGLASSRLDNVKERINWTHEKKNDDSAGHGTFVASVITGTEEDCAGIAPEADLFVFRMFTDDQLSFTSWYLDAFNYALFKGIHILNLSTGGPDFQDLPFVEKIQELTANGMILVSAVGNNGPRYGLLSNPADQMEVIGVGGITADGEVAEFSSRGMTTWEFPFGSGRVKPDIVALAQDVAGSDMNNGCKTMSGTSASAPIVTASIAVLASMIPEQDRWQVLNPASMKQILLESADQLEAWRESEAHVVHNHIFEQGAGKLNVSRASELVADKWNSFDTARRENEEAAPGTAQKPSSFPDRIDTTQCPYMWPLCSQPLFHGSLPLMVNLTILNPGSVSGKLVGAPEWIPANNGSYVTVSVASPDIVWPYYGSLGIFIEVKKDAAWFQGVVSGSLVIKIKNNDQTDEVSVPMKIQVAPAPPKSRRILWDQFRNIPYPSAFVPRDSLENTYDLLDSAGDHPHTNFHELWNFLIDEGYFVDILPFELSCVSLEQYGVVMMVDPEEEFFAEEESALRQALKYSNVSLIVLADWFDEAFIDSMEMFDTSTLSRWHAVTGGSNIPALNKLLREFHIAFGEGAVSNGSISMLSADADSFPYWSGSFLTAFPVGGYLGFIDAVDQIASILNGSVHVKHDVPVLGLYQIPSRNGGRIAVFGDSACVDASSHSPWSASPNFRNCFEMINSLLKFTNEGVLPYQLGNENLEEKAMVPAEAAQGSLHLLDKDYGSAWVESDKRWPATMAPPSTANPDVKPLVQERSAVRYDEFARYSKVARAAEAKSAGVSFCHFYRRQECSESAPHKRVTMQAVVTR